MKNNKKNLIKAILIFIIYFIYSSVLGSIFHSLSLNSVLSSLLSDIVFILIISYFYKDSLKEDINRFKKIGLKEIIKNVIGWTFVILVANIFIGLIINTLAPTYASKLDSNTDAITKLDLYYSVFKTMIFSIYAEELLFKKSISDFISNKVIFVIVSTLVYCAVLLLYSGVNSEYILFEFLKYFTVYLLFSIAYVKNEDNIIMLMIIKFTYQLIPLIILLTS